MSVSESNSPLASYRPFASTLTSSLATTAHGTHSGSSRGQQDHSDSTTLLPGAFVFLPTQVPIGAHSTLQAVPGEDTIRQYGFLGGLGRTIVLGVDEVARVIRDVGAELGRRALDTPMLFSNQSLEISQTRLRMIVQSYVGTLK